MPTREALGSDFVSIVVADSTHIYTQLLADALRTDRGLQVVAAASNSSELLAAISRVPIDVAVISHSLDDEPGRGTRMLREDALAPSSDQGRHPARHLQTATGTGLFPCRSERDFFEAGTLRKPLQMHSQRP